MAIPCPPFIGSEKLSVESGAMSPSSPSPLILTQDELKKIAAYKAVDFVQSGMGIPTSKKTHQQAVSLGIPLSDLDSHPVVDLAIDGADEVDSNLNLVKGRGGSLLREKMIESACKKFIVIVDESKLVAHVGASGAMPVEVVPFCWKFTQDTLQNLFDYAGCVAKLRTDNGGEKIFVTDNGNYIVDLFFEKDIGDLNVASGAILRLAGVVEHGMFLDMATTVIVAGELGITIKNK
ncbi:hypothetical protein OIU78_007007 [Salix suchowensis]|nr:hypothetical protein OIU78_007007 [Salix suchowensis]